MSQGRGFVWRRDLKNPGQESWVGQGLRESPGEVTCVRLVETQIWLSVSARGLGVEPNKGTVPSFGFLSGRKLQFQPSVSPDNSFPPRVSLAPFELLPQRWCLEQVSPSVVNVRMGPLRGRPSTPAALCLT